MDIQSNPIPPLPSLDHTLVRLLGEQGKALRVSIVERLVLSLGDLSKLESKLPPTAPLKAALNDAISKLSGEKPIAPENRPTLVKLSAGKPLPPELRWVLLDRVPPKDSDLIIQRSPLGLRFSYGKTPVQPHQRYAHAPQPQTNIDKTQASSLRLSTPTINLHSPEEQQTVQDGLRRHLPKQDTQFTLAKTLLANHRVPMNKEQVQAALNHANKDVRMLARALQHTQHWRSTLPSVIQPNPSAIAATLRNSGELLENKLFSAPAQSTDSRQHRHATTADVSIDTDYKALHLLLLGAIKPLTLQRDITPSDNKILQVLVNILFQQFQPKLVEKPSQALPRLSLEQVETLLHSSLAKISSNQLSVFSAAAKDINAPAVLHGDLIFRLHDWPIPVQFQLWQLRENTHEKKDKPKITRHWRILLEWSFPEYGAFSSEITVQGNKVESTLWAEAPDIRKQIKAGLPLLKERLEYQGVQVARLQCATHTVAPPKPQRAEQLIDVRT